MKRRFYEWVFYERTQMFWIPYILGTIEMLIIFTYYTFVQWIVEFNKNVEARLKSTMSGIMLIVTIIHILCIIYIWKCYAPKYQSKLVRFKKILHEKAGDSESPKSPTNDDEIPSNENNDNSNSDADDRLSLGSPDDDDDNDNDSHDSNNSQKKREHKNITKVSDIWRSHNDGSNSNSENSNNDNDDDDNDTNDNENLTENNSEHKTSLDSSDTNRNESNTDNSRNNENENENENKEDNDNENDSNSVNSENENNSRSRHGPRLELDSLDVLLGKNGDLSPTDVKEMEKETESLMCSIWGNSPCGSTKDGGERELISLRNYNMMREGRHFSRLMNEERTFEYDPNASILRRSEQQRRHRRRNQLNSSRFGEHRRSRERRQRRERRERFELAQLHRQQRKLRKNRLVYVDYRLSQTSNNNNNTNNDNNNNNNNNNNDSNTHENVDNSNNNNNLNNENTSISSNLKKNKNKHKQKHKHKKRKNRIKNGFINESLIDSDSNDDEDSNSSGLDDSHEERERERERARERRSRNSKTETGKGKGKGKGKEKETVDIDSSTSTDSDIIHEHSKYTKKGRRLGVSFDDLRNFDNGGDSLVFSSNIEAGSIADLERREKLKHKSHVENNNQNENDNERDNDKDKDSDSDNSLIGNSDNENSKSSNNENVNENDEAENDDNIFVDEIENEDINIRNNDIDDDDKNNNNGNSRFFNENGELKEGVLCAISEAYSTHMGVLVERGWELYIPIQRWLGVSYIKNTTNFNNNNEMLLRYCLFKYILLIIWATETFCNNFDEDEKVSSILTNIYVVLIRWFMYCLTLLYGVYLNFIILDRLTTRQAICTLMVMLCCIFVVASIFSVVFYFSENDGVCNISFILFCLLSCLFFFFCALLFDVDFAFASFVFFVFLFSVS